MYLPVPYFWYLLLFTKPMVMQPCYFFTCFWKVTFLPLSRLATLFTHNVNTMFIFVALVMLCCAVALPFWVYKLLLTAPCFLGGVLNALSISDYAHCRTWLCYVVTAVLFLDFVIFLNSFFGYFRPVRLHISWTTFLIVLSNNPDNNGSRGIFASPAVLFIVCLSLVYFCQFH